jgi:hypothetical protein
MSVESPYFDPELASAYGRLAAPSQFMHPAQDLVGLLDLSIGAKVLDVGSGFGVCSPPSVGIGSRMR